MFRKLVDLTVHSFVRGVCPNLRRKLFCVNRPLPVQTDYKGPLRVRTHGPPVETVRRLVRRCGAGRTGYLVATGRGCRPGFRLFVSRPCVEVPVVFGEAVTASGDRRDPVVRLRSAVRSRVPVPSRHPDPGLHPHCTRPSLQSGTSLCLDPSQPPGPQLGGLVERRSLLDVPEDPVSVQQSVQRQSEGPQK